MRRVFVDTKTPQFSVWIEKARQGNRAAFDDLFVAQAPRIHLYIRSRMSSRLRQSLDPSDVMQEVFLRAFKNIKVFRGDNEQEFYHWLRWNADKHILDEVKKLSTKKRGGHLLPSMPPRGTVSETIRNLADRRHGPKTSAWLREQAQRLFEAFDSLPKQFQQIIACRHLKGMSTRETAKKLGLRENTVDVYYLRAMRKWREVASI